MKKRTLHQTLIITSFLLVPLIVSFISTMHIISLFQLGNISWMAVLLSITFELGSLASLLSFSVLHQIKKGPIYLIFGVLFLMQLAGNIYYCFDYCSLQVIANPHWLDTFRELLSFIIGETPELGLTKFIISLIIGTLIPLVSLCFSKSLVDYIEKINELVDNQAIPQPAPLAIKIEEEILPGDTKDIEKIVEGTVEESPVEEVSQIEKTTTGQDHGIQVAVFQNSKN